SDSTIMEDSSNSFPASMSAARNLLSKTPGRHIAVLVDMLELGAYEDTGHRHVAGRAREVADFLVLVCRLGHFMGEEALHAGMAPDRVFFAAGNAQVIQYLKGVLQPGDHVLVKGSRGLHLEE